MTPDSPARDAPLIRLEGVSHGYREGTRSHRVLEGVDLEVARGQVLALLGRSGSGKTTLLNLLGGIDQPQAGRIEIAGQRIDSLGEPERSLFRRRHIGFVYQFFNLIPTLSLSENLALPLELNRVAPKAIAARVAELLEAVGLADRADDFPDRLSGGEQQRVAIARALAHRPKLVLADEPTGNLDATTGGRILELLSGIYRNEDQTLVLVTHSLQVAKHADRVLMLDQGRLAPPSEEIAW